MSGEEALVYRKAESSFLDKPPFLFKGYSPRDIYKGNATGLLIIALPNKTHILKKEKCNGGKLPKERITILHYANMRRDKVTLLMICKAAQAGAFNNIILYNYLLVELSIFS